MLMYTLHVVYRSAVSSDVSIAYVMEGISLFGATPRLSAIPTGGFIISASRITGEAPLVAGSPVADEVPMLEEVHAQGFVESESVMDLGVILETSSNVDSAVDHDSQAEGASASVADIPANSEHLDNIGEFEFLTFRILLVIVCCMFCLFFFFFFLDLIIPY